MEQHVCIVCCQPFDTGAILLDRRLRNTLDRHTVTGWGRCPTHSDPEYVYLVGCRTSPHGDRVHDPADADRSGEVMQVKVEAWSRCFNVPLPKDRVAFVEQAVIEEFKRGIAAQEART
jgi:hypothetical protein